MCEQPFAANASPAPLYIAAKGTAHSPTSHSSSERERKHPNQKEIPLSRLQEHFALSIQAAAGKLGVCVTTLKKICRSYGIKRWPGRKLRKAGSANGSARGAHALESYNGGDWPGVGDAEAQGSDGSPTPPPLESASPVMKEENGAHPLQPERRSPAPPALTALLDGYGPSNGAECKTGFSNGEAHGSGGRTAVAPVRPSPIAVRPPPAVTVPPPPPLSSRALAAPTFLPHLGSAPRPENGAAAAGPGAMQRQRRRRSKGASGSEEEAGERERQRSRQQQQTEREASGVEALLSIASRAVVAGAPEPAPAPAPAPAPPLSPGSPSSGSPASLDSPGTSRSQHGGQSPPPVLIPVPASPSGPACAPPPSCPGLDPGPRSNGGLAGGSASDAGLRERIMRQVEEWLAGRELSETQADALVEMALEKHEKVMALFGGLSNPGILLRHARKIADAFRAPTAHPPPRPGPPRRSAHTAPPRRPPPPSPPPPQPPSPTGRPRRPSPGSSIPRPRAATALACPAPEERPAGSSSRRRRRW
eukprot:tig00001304_g8107.t1